VKGKKIIVGISGGIAAYKAAELVRLFVKAEVYTQVAMTSNASQFVTPFTFEALSGNRVICDMFRQEGPDMEHITWGQETEVLEMIFCLPWSLQPRPKYWFALP